MYMMKRILYVIDIFESSYDRIYIDTINRKNNNNNNNNKQNPQKSWSTKRVQLLHSFVSFAKRYAYANHCIPF